MLVNKRMLTHNFLNIILKINCILEIFSLRIILGIDFKVIPLFGKEGLGEI